MLGAGIPLLSKHVKFFKVDPFFICLGKCMGIGIILACALVHMLQPASQSLISPCLPWEFNTDYQAYAFMLCMVAIILMHLVDFTAENYMMSHWHLAQSNVNNRDTNGMVEISTPHSTSNGNGTADSHGHAHTHSIILTPGMKKTLSAYLLEFGVTVHSVFIGLENGVVGQEELHVLLVALSFHQFFEGIALGSRIADAELPNRWQEFFLCFIFSIAAPLGIAIGIAITASVNPNGRTYLLVEGIFDAICAGILLHIGLSLLINDFREDVKVHCKGDPKRRNLMFISLWIGAGLMAYIGKYL